MIAKFYEIFFQIFDSIICYSQGGLFCVELFCNRFQNLNGTSNMILRILDIESELNFEILNISQF